MRSREQIRFLAEYVVLEEVDDLHHVMWRVGARQQVLEHLVFVFEAKDVLGVDPFGDERREHAAFFTTRGGPSMPVSSATSSGAATPAACARRSPAVKTSMRSWSADNAAILGLGSAAAVVTHRATRLAAQCAVAGDQVTYAGSNDNEESDVRDELDRPGVANDAHDSDDECGGERHRVETEVECRNLGVGPLRAVVARALGWWFERGERP